MGWCLWSQFDWWSNPLLGTLHLSQKGQPQGIAPTIENGHVGAILYGCPQHFWRVPFIISNPCRYRTRWKKLEHWVQRIAFLNELIRIIGSVRGLKWNWWDKSQSERFKCLNGRIFVSYWFHWLFQLKNRHQKRANTLICSYNIYNQKRANTKVSPYNIYLNVFTKKFEFGIWILKIKTMENSKHVEISLRHQ